MAGFRIIPVIDLRGGLVVRARAGDRDAYAPIVTPLARTAEPAAVARGLLAASPGDILYLADLDIGQRDIASRIERGWQHRGKGER